MATKPDFRAMVIRQARETGADLPVPTVDELAAHLEDLYLAARAEGRSEPDARAAVEQALAESALATVPRPRSRVPESRPWAAPEPTRRYTGLGGDIRFALRQLRRSPAFAAVAIATLGLGAGAATAIFSIVDKVLLRPLPYRQPDALVAIWESNTEKGLPRERLSPVNFMDYRDVTSVFADAAGWWRPEINLADPGTDPVRVSTIETSGNLFQILGVGTALGPGFPADGPFFSRDPIAVISDRLWRQRYNGDPQIVGRTLQVNGGQYTIAGVMPPRFHFPDDVDIWLRLQWDFHQHSRGAHFVEAIGRLKPGATTEQAARELAALSARLGEAEANKQTNRGWLARPVPLLNDMLGYYRPALFVLMGAVSLLLLTACFNVASLLLARATIRAREIAVRAALGASRLRLVRQLLVESLLLAAAGTIAGGVGAQLLLQLAIASMPVAVPRLADARLDLRLLTFAVAVVASTAVVFGLVPALLLSRTRAAEALKESGRTATGVRGRKWNRSLVVVEVALACTVLVASALLVRSVTRMIRAPLGVQTSGVLIAGLQLNPGGYPTWEKVEQSYTTLLASVRGRPGVDAAGAASTLPLDPGWRLPFQVEGRPPAVPSDMPIAQHVSVSSGYFETFHATLVSGRFFADSDQARGEPVIVVNQTFARQVFPGEDPVSKRIQSTALQIGPLGRNIPGRVPFRIVGVVADIQQAPLGQAGEPVVYHTQRQFPFRAMTVVVRGKDPAAATAALRSAVRELDASLALADVRTMDERLMSAVTAPRLLMFVLTTFAVLTASLAAIGVYGLLACVVNERRRELAIRLALGARPSTLARIVTTEGLLLALGGIAVGVVGAQLGGGLLKDVLFQTRPSDLTAIGAAGGILLVAAGIACLAPARRAARVPPSEGLKTE
jgi:putative ABC transport system permease protein